MPKFVNKTARALIVEGVRFLPGKNDFPDMDEVKLGRILGNPCFKSWKDLHMIEDVVDASGMPAQAPVAASEPEPESEPAPVVESSPEPVSELAGLNVMQARALIEVCEDQEKLLEWFESDSRQTVKNDCEKRLEKLSVPEPDPELAA